jgi:hypothetical protein
MDRWYSQINSICVDNNGNVYAAGKFQNVIDFDPSIPVFTIMPQSSAAGESCFIWKLSASGQFLGAGEFGGGIRPGYFHQ